MFGRSRFGVASIGAAASVPWNVCPTMTTSMAPFASCESWRGSAASSADANKFATFLPASWAPRRDLSK